MTSKTKIDATARLAELEEAARTARDAERAARDEQEAALRKVAQARGALTAAYASGDGVEDAEETLADAQAAAGGAALDRMGRRLRRRCSR